MSTLPLRRFSKLLFALPLFATSACSDVDLAPADTAYLQASLDRFAARAVSDDACIGLGISVRMPDGRTFRAAAGHSDPDGRAAYDGAATEQVIGSVTKLYTAVLVMQLVEAGVLSLEDTLDRWFDFPGVDRITLRMLLEHTSGLPEFLTGMSMADVGHPWTPEALVDRALGFERYGEPPLAQAVYSNTPSVLLALIVEAETGETWEDNIAARIAEPLGLTHTYHAGEADKAGALAGGWLRTDAGWIDVMDVLDPSVGWGGGAIVTTNDELMRFAQAFFAGELFEDPATLQAMLDFDVVMDPSHLGEEPPSTVGLAVLRMEVDGVRLDGHLGHTHGYNAGLVRDPDTGAIIVVTSNDDRARAGYPILEIARFLRSR